MPACLRRNAERANAVHQYLAAMPHQLVAMPHQAVVAVQLQPLIVAVLHQYRAAVAQLLHLLPLAAVVVAFLPVAVPLADVVA